MPRSSHRLLVVGLTALALAGCSRPSPLAPAAEPGRGTHAFTSDDRVTERVIVTLVPEANPFKVAEDQGCECIGWEYDEYTAALLTPAGMTREEFAAQVLTDERVRTCEPDAWLEPAEARQQSFSFDDGFGDARSFQEQPAGEAIGLAAAHRVSIGEDVRVAVLDTGIDPDHPELHQNVIYGRDFVDDDYDPRDVTNGDDDDLDGHIDEAYGHGTHVTGILMLVAPGARFLPVRVLDADGRGTVMSVASGIRWAVHHGAKVINTSLGTLTDSPAIALALAEADAQGVIVVSSAGNWGGPTPVEFPARSSDALAVAAVDAQRQPATFTSYGTFVDLGAPGVGVRSTFPGGGYRLWSGTSMSAPFVSGVTALLVALHPTWTMTDVMARLAATCAPVVGGTYAQRHGLGAGALDAAAALAPDAWTPGSLEPEPDPLAVRPNR